MDLELDGLARVVVEVLPPAKAEARGKEGDFVTVDVGLNVRAWVGCVDRQRRGLVLEQARDMAVERADGELGRGVGALGRVILRLVLTRRAERNSNNWHWVTPGWCVPRVVGLPGIRVYPGIFEPGCIQKAPTVKSGL
jgi:hypothetical protein